MDEWAFVLIVALCIAIGGLSHRGDTLAQALLTVAPSLGLGCRWGPVSLGFTNPSEEQSVPRPAQNQADRGRIAIPREASFRRASCGSDAELHETERPIKGKSSRRALLAFALV